MSMEIMIAKDRRISGSIVLMIRKCKSDGEFGMLGGTYEAITRILRDCFTISLEKAVLPCTVKGLHNRCC